MKESNTQREIWKSLNQSILFRVNTGKALVSANGTVKWLQDGSALVMSARPISLGFSLSDGKPVVGTSDLVGWTSVLVTASMVGQRVAVFTAIECKKSTGGVKSDAQRTFLSNVIKAGGIAGFASSPDDAREVMADFNERMGI